MAVLWGATPDGVSNKLPTREGRLDGAQVVDNLETCSGYLLSIVGSEGAVPAGLVELAARTVEWGAASLTEQQDFPEQSTAKTSTAQVCWAQFEKLAAQVLNGVTAVGGEPPVSERPAFNFGPTRLIEWLQF